MYKLPHFTEDNPQAVIAFMREYSFALVTGFAGEYPVASHLPLDIREEKETLIFSGHMMRNTDHHKAFVANDRVLVIFNGPHCHVSAGWYQKPAVASTWNYMAVHAKGKISFGDDHQTLQMVKQITDKYEHPESEAAFNKLHGDYVERLLQAIVGFTIKVEKYDHVFKLSQNHDEITRKSIIAHLEARGDDNSTEIAAEMQKRLM